jgi:metal-sulfur cluster biosynthetic enzyme
MDNVKTEHFKRDEKLLEWLKPVEDPEMFLSIVDLGLIYEAEFKDQGTGAEVKMTLTSPHCPVADQFVGNVKTRLLEYPGVDHAEVQLVFEPKWDPKEMASDEVKDRLGIW